MLGSQPSILQEWRLGWVSEGHLLREGIPEVLPARLLLKPGSEPERGIELRPFRYKIQSYGKPRPQLWNWDGTGMPWGGLWSHGPGSSSPGAPSVCSGFARGSLGAPRTLSGSSGVVMPGEVAAPQPELGSSVAPAVPTLPCSCLSRITRSGLLFDPAFPDDITKLNISGVSYLGNKLEVTITREETRMEVTETSRDPPAPPLEAVLESGQRFPLREGTAAAPGSAP